MFVSESKPLPCASGRVRDILTFPQHQQTWVVFAGAQNKIKNLADRAKAYVNNVSELELKVLEATNHDPWGPHGSVMQGRFPAAGTAAGMLLILLIRCCVESHGTCGSLLCYVHAEITNNAFHSEGFYQILVSLRKARCLALAFCPCKPANVPHDSRYATCHQSTPKQHQSSKRPSSRELD
jgi:hypothetical protein